MKYFASAAIVLLTTVFTFAQHQHSDDHCATMDVLHDVQAADPAEYAAIQAAERQVQDFIANGGVINNGRVVITIPTVVHVVHEGEAIGTGRNLSDAVVQNQIDILNEDFRKLNADIIDVVPSFQGIAADVEIQFCLATKDEQGNPTNGIIRHEILGAPWSSNQFNQTVKPQTNWDRDQYLNFWICELSGTLLGYATFPGGNASRDGIVVGHEYIGRPPFNIYTNNYNRGRTATHEIGHWLGLRHIWGDGDCSQDDGISDTPNQDGSNGGCSTTRTTCGSLDNTQNYMDYSFDRCLLMFTEGQKQVMQATLNSSRVSILSSLGCDNTPVITHSGRVVDATTGLGVAQGKALFDGGNFLYEVTGDNNGEFTIQNFREGTYDVYGGKWSYQTNQKSTNTFIQTGDFSIIPITYGEYYDDFIMDYGWTVSGTAGTGVWERDFPDETTFNSIPSNPGVDVSTDYIGMAYVTGNGGGGAGDDDVDNGITTLESPIFDASIFADPKISFYAWFFNDGGNGAPVDDDLVITISNGATSFTLTTINSNIPNSNSWTFYEFNIRDYMLPTNTMQVVFETSDLVNGHIVEAGVDVFRVWEGLSNSIEDPIEELGMNVFPNPSTGQFTVSLDNPANRPLTYSVFNTLGQAVEFGEWPEGLTDQLNIDLSAQGAGVYIIRLEGEGYQDSQRVMVR